MANTGSRGIARYEERWLADNISTASADGIAWVVSSDSSDTAFARAVAAGRGLHAAGALAATQNNLIELCHDLAFIYGQNGHAALEVVFMMDNISAIAFNIGLNDESLEDANTLPVELATTTWTSNAASFVGLVYDTGADNDELHCFWVDDDSDTSEAIADLRMKGIAPVASKWMRARIDIQDRGSSQGVRATFSFSVDGKSAEKVFNTSLDRDVALCPYIGIEQRGSPSATNVYIAYIAIEQSLAD